MKHSVYLLFTLSLLVLFISDASTCKCTAGLQGRGPFCGGELLKNNGGSDCSSDIWHCNGLGTNATWLNLCNFGCCGPPNSNSFCCLDDICSNCTPTNRYIKTSQTSEFPCASYSPSSPSSTSCPLSQDSVATIIGAVFGGVATAVATIVAAIILARCKKKKHDENSSLGH